MSVEIVVVIVREIGRQIPNLSGKSDQFIRKVSHCTRQLGFGCFRRDRTHFDFRSFGQLRAGWEDDGAVGNSANKIHVMPE